MKVYKVKRTPKRVTAEVVEGGNEYALSPRLDLRRHSPTGFEYGYEGSGPAQLALAILADFLDDESALRLYQEFKREIIGRMSAPSWELTAAQITEWRGTRSGLRGRE